MQTEFSKLKPIETHLPIIRADATMSLTVTSACNRMERHVQKWEKELLTPPAKSTIGAMNLSNMLEASTPLLAIRFGLLGRVSKKLRIYGLNLKICRIDKISAALVTKVPVAKATLGIGPALCIVGHGYVCQGPACCHTANERWCCCPYGP